MRSAVFSGPCGRRGLAVERARPASPRRPSRRTARARRPRPPGGRAAASSVSRRSTIVARCSGSPPLKRRPTRSFVGHDLAQAAGVGHDARAAGGHRLERHQPERLVQRGHHREVGDPVERVQHVVADPAEEGAVGVEAQLGGLLAQVGLGGARAGDHEAHVAQPLDHARQRLERELEALLVDQPAHQQHQPSRRGAAKRARSVSRSSTGTSSLGSIPLGMTAMRSSSRP